MGEVRNLRLIERVIGPAPEHANKDEAARHALMLHVLDKHAPAFVKEGRQLERAEVQHVIDAAVKVAVETVRHDHRNELVSLQLTNDQHAERIEQTTRHRVGSARGMWLAIGILAGATVGVIGTQRVMKDGMFGLVAASRSANDVWAPPESPSVRDVPRCENVADCPALEH